MTETTTAAALADLIKQADETIAWQNEGCPVDDPYDTYPADLWAAMTAPDQLRPLLDALAKLSEGACAPVAAWQPIETAPKDGTRVLAYREDWVDCYAVAWWSKGSGEWERNDSQFRDASHWMPIQDPDAALSLHQTDTKEQQP